MTRSETLFLTRVTLNALALIRCLFGLFASFSIPTEREISTDYMGRSIRTRKLAKKGLEKRAVSFFCSYRPLLHAPERVHFTTACATQAGPGRAFCWRVQGRSEVTHALPDQVRSQPVTRLGALKATILGGLKESQEHGLGRSSSSAAAENVYLDS